VLTEGVLGAGQVYGLAGCRWGGVAKKIAHPA